MSFKKPDNIDFTKPTELCQIMEFYGSDKGGTQPFLLHNYTQFYYPLFKNRQFENLNIFELGLGTNNTSIPSNMGKHGKPGASLRGWKKFFQNSNIFGADIDRDILFEEERIKTYWCDQTSPEAIKNMWNDKSLPESFDIIIEDGLHTFEANKIFFENSIHKLKKGGVFIIEDIRYDSLLLFRKLLIDWESKYLDCSFFLNKLPNVNNRVDNNIIVVFKE